VGRLRWKRFDWFLYTGAQLDAKYWEVGQEEAGSARSGVDKGRAESVAPLNAGMPRSTASTDSESPAGIPSSC
jgi:hypothetical protein